MLVSLFAFLAGLMPSIYAALKFDADLEGCVRAVAEFKNIQDRFRQIALISSKKSFEEFERDFDELVERLEQARASSTTPPERFHKAARKKIKAGDYEFDVDLENEETNEKASALRPLLRSDSSSVAPITSSSNGRYTDPKYSF